MLGALVERVSAIDLVRAPTYRPHIVGRGPAALPVRLRPA
ncbi:hypothetical protein FRACA_1630001 [Frankia canadensis]|uniref:Uncharacterized protein n=1 Tax=Frankia canadensis TaxID=1836972 RepID=A0A2I2KMR4_9ACTN|nr:hypothetical protein FRACA_1630001 [Frankia canadensis]SOU54244.1 hypothetical protein FRACA_1630001 [Frankia canadensis]